MAPPSTPGDPGLDGPATRVSPRSCTLTSVAGGQRPAPSSWLSARSNGAFACDWAQLEARGWCRGPRVEDAEGVVGLLQLAAGHPCDECGERAGESRFAAQLLAAS